MVCVYRWGGWLKLPPDRHLVGKLRFRPDGLLPIPVQYLPQLGGSFYPAPWNLFRVEGWDRFGFGMGGSIAAACNVAWGVVQAKPWNPNTLPGITNWHYAHNYGGPWGATVYQSYCRLTLPPSMVRAWQPWLLEIYGGWPSSGPKGLGFWALGEYLKSKAGSYFNAEVGWRTTHKGLVLDCSQRGGFFQPPYPTAAGQVVGVLSGLTWPAILVR
jgi:hypothetical protein